MTRDPDRGWLLFDKRVETNTCCASVVGLADLLQLQLVACTCKLEDMQFFLVLFVCKSDCLFHEGARRLDDTEDFQLSTD